MSSSTPTVFIVDGDRTVRDSLTALIDAAGWQAELFADAEQLLARPRIGGPTCLLLNIDSAGADGLALQRRVAAERREMPVIIMTSRGDIPMTVQAMKAGAVALLTKPLADDMVLAAIWEGVERSREFLLRDNEVRDLRVRYQSLSMREREVMSLVVAGLLNKQVAGRLGISEITVKAHRGKVMRKMQADSLPDLVTMAASLGISPAGGSLRELRSYRPLQLLATGPRFSSMFETPARAG